MSKPKPPLSLTETRIGIVILILLGGIAIGVLMSQFRSNPANLSSISLQSEIKPSKPSSPSRVDTLISPPESIHPLTPPESFDERTLSDKIDGKAELYLSAGFSELRSQRFSLDDEAAWMEVFVYEMDNAQSAFSVFSAQRRDNTAPLNITPHAYITDNALFFKHGNYYVEIIAAAENLTEPMKALARQVVAQVTVETEETLSEIDLFPEKSLQKDSIVLLSSNVFGYDKLDNTYTAVYSFEEGSTTVFLSRRKSAEDAEALASGYSNFLTAFGGKGIEPISEIPNIQIIEIMDTFEVIFTKDQYLMGVHSADNIETALKAAQLIANAI